MPSYKDTSAAIAQWICLHLPSCCPGSSPKHTIYALSLYVKFVLYLYCEKNKKNQKSCQFGPFKKRYEWAL